jgi:Short C-terminal domain
MALFGSSKRLEKKLEKNGTAATAEITQAEKTHWINSSGAQAVGGQNSTVTWHLTLQVKPDGAAPFDATITDAFPLGDDIVVGHSVSVLFDPADHSKVVIDHSPKGEIASFMAGMSPGATAAIASSGAGGALDSLMQDAAKDPSGVLARWRSDPDAAVAAFRSQMTAPTTVNPAVTPATPGAESPEDRLTKLADLRDRGAITDAEFQAQKKQILGE